MPVPQPTGKKLLQLRLINMNILLQRLTSRERQILKLVGGSFSREDMRSKLKISRRNFNSNVSSLYKKFDVNNLKSIYTYCKLKGLI